MKKLRALFALLAVSFCAAANADTITVFTEGTFAGDSRYSVKKQFGGVDDELCWAASASNILQLWQDRRAGEGFEIPQSVPGAGGDIGSQALRSQEIFDVFVSNWEQKAGIQTLAYQWYMTGSYDQSVAEGTGASLPLDGSSAGGYWSGLGLDFAGISEITQFYDNENEKDSGAFKRYLDTAFSEGWMVSLSVNNWNNHAINLWGYEWDSVTGELTGLWISDSDQEGVFSNYLVDVHWDWNDFGKYGMWTLGDAHFDDPSLEFELSGWWVTRADAFTVPPSAIPEPAAIASAFAFASALAAAGRRLRRRVRPAKKSLRAAGFSSNIHNF